jgi:hypothetical protein
MPSHTLPQKSEQYSANLIVLCARDTGRKTPQANQKGLDASPENS